MGRLFINVGLLLALNCPLRAQNLLQNPGFENEGGWNAYESSSLRNMWRSHDGGEFNAGLLGLWSESGLNAMVEQRDVPVQEGNPYMFQGWVWADLGWVPLEQYMKVVFFDAEQQVIQEDVKPLKGIHPFWSLVKFKVVAPKDAVSAAVSFGASNVSVYGALTIDDVYFGDEALAPPAW